MQIPDGPHCCPMAQHVDPQGVPVQQIPWTHDCPAWQQLDAPHTVVPGAQQPPAGSGAPVQQMLPEQIWPCWQHWLPQTVPEAQQMLLTQGVPAPQQPEPHGTLPIGQQPPPGLTVPVGPVLLCVGACLGLSGGSESVPTEQAMPSPLKPGNGEAAHSRCW
jgi:hypothetical protein